jgi:PAS domain S-box-containing protein
MNSAMISFSSIFASERMKASKHIPDLIFHELSLFARFVKDNFLNEFVREQIHLSQELKLPVLSYLKSMTNEELIAASKISSVDFLTCLEENKASERIVKAQQRWVENKMGFVKSDEITAEDITLVSYIQKQSFLKLVMPYTTVPEKIIALIKELDHYYLEVEKASTNTYINILKSRLGARESQLLEAQALSHVGNWTWDFENKKLIWTDELYRIYGLPPQSEITNEEIRRFNHPDDAEYVKQQMDDANESNGHSDFVYRIILKDGTIKYLHARGETQKDKHGQITKIVGTLQDITQQKLIEQALFQKNLELQQSNTNLEEFAYIASHDLKEPLRKISILGDKLLITQQETLNENGKNYLTKIIDSAQRMQTMINDLLSVSIITGDRTFENCDLQVILDEVLSTLEYKIESQKAKIQSDRLPEAMINVPQFRQLFQNLLSNSLKFTKKEVAPEITITHKYLRAKQVKEFDLIAANRYLQLKITDNGIGFENEYSNKIFSIFKRLHSQSEYDGTGIGLSICKKIVENHNGVIFAFGKPGVGATFTIIIPVN